MCHEQGPLLVPHMPLEVGADPAGHHRVGQDPVVGPPVARLDGEQRVGGLRLPVRQPWVVGTLDEVDVVEDDRREQMRTGAHRHHAGPAGLDQCAVQTGGEGEVPEVVDGELELPALFGTGLGCRHHPRVVDQDVQWPGPCGRERADRGRIGKIQGSHLYLGRTGRGGNGRGHTLSRCRVTYGQGDLRAGPGECAGGLHAEARSASGDDGAAAAQVDSGDDVGGSGLGGEGSGDACGGHTHAIPALIRCNRRTLRFP